MNERINLTVGHHVFFDDTNNAAMAIVEFNTLSAFVHTRSLGRRVASINTLSS